VRRGGFSRTSVAANSGGEGLPARSPTEVPVNPVDRRTFFRNVAAVSAATAASTLVPGMVLPLGAAALPGSEPAPDWHRTPCRLCGVGCGLLVRMSDGRPVAVRGDPDSPVGGGLACVKGYSSVQALSGADRIRRARIRRNGTMVEVPLGEALDLVAQRLRETAQKHGKDSVALYGSAQWSVTDAYAASKLFKGALGTNNIESSTRLFAASAMAGLQGSFGLDGSIGCYEDVDHADVLVLWDVNLAETDPVLYSRMLERKRTDPAVRIIDLSTRTTRTSYAADHSLLHVPYGSLAIANAICYEIVARKWVNRKFVTDHVAFKRGATDIGYGLTDGALVEEVATNATWNEYVSFLADYTPERAQELSGLSAASIRWLASIYGDPQRKVMSVWGRQVNQNVRGTWLNNVLYNIHLLVGKVAAPGNGPLATTGQPSGGCAVHDAGSLTETLPRGVVQNEEDRRLAAQIWGVPVERIDPRPTGPALSMFRRLDQGEIRFLWIMATDPMVSLPNLDRYRQAAAKEDRFIVVSEAYPTPTTEVADVILPAAMWLEREGVYVNVERRAQYFPRLVTPPGDATGDAWQLIEIARRLGFKQLFPYDQGRHVEQLWAEYCRFHTEPQSALPPISALRAQPGVMWPYVAGRETRWRYNTARDPAADHTQGEFDFYGHPDHRAWVWLRPHQPPAESPDQAYPSWLITGSVLEQWGAGSMTQRIPTLHHALPHAYVEVNADDARDLGVRNHETVRLVSKRGSVEIQARIDYRSQPPRGQLFAPWFDETRPVNRLTLDACCPLSGQPDAASCPVRLERVT
jgi:nitrate reductase NapA